uniref:Protein kinase domain-containing protein n=1 Tax=Pyrodinium bahamense TaxID=73915 RepID=A0A7S0FDT1_9DINO
MDGSSACQRLQGALKREFPDISCDEAILSHLAQSLEGKGLPSADDVVESWAPFLIALDACSDDEEAHRVCCRLLQRLSAEASPKDSAEATARAAAGSRATPAAPAPASAAGSRAAPSPVPSPCLPSEEEYLKQRPTERATWEPKAKVGQGTRRRQQRQPHVGEPAGLDETEDRRRAADAARRCEENEQQSETVSAELEGWLERLRLEKYSERARAWCEKEGAVHLNEVLENWEDFANALSLKPLERKRVEKDVNSRRGPPEPPASPQPPPPASPQPPSPGTQVGPPVPVLPAQPSSASSSSKGSFGPPDDLQRYTLLEELGQGATATVYRCRRGEVQFAVKTISLAKLRLQRDYQRITDKLNREVQILFKLRHPRIVSLFDVVEETDKLHLVMELVEGGPEGIELFDYIVARGSFTEPVARYVFLQIVEGLKFIHLKDIVYRDLKPENILVDEKASRRNEGLFEVKLSDFGHSKLINDGYSTALTRVGTPQYWAPEVNDPAKAAKGYDQTVDLWSLGVVLYVMLIGAYPFDGMGEPIEEQMRRARLNFRSASGGMASESAQDLIRALIVVDPRRRLNLDGCRNHPWVVIPGGTLDQVMTPFDDSHVQEERVHLPNKPSKSQVEELRRDLHVWMKQYKCSAQVKQDYVIANIDERALDGRVSVARQELQQMVQFYVKKWGNTPENETSAPSRQSHWRPEPVLPAVPERRPGFRFRMVNHVLRVSSEHGAGLDLLAERGGMRVQMIYDQPGQPGLQIGDLITKINEVSLRRGDEHQVEGIFGTHFCDGAQLAIKREC